MARRLSRKLCPHYQLAAELVGKRWTPIIIKVLLETPRRFNELLDCIEVVSDRMLSERLKELEAAGIVVRAVLPEPPVRVQYSLSPKGLALAEVVQALEEWGTQWQLAPPPDRPALPQLQPSCLLAASGPSPEATQCAQPPMAALAAAPVSV